MDFNEYFIRFNADLNDVLPIKYEKNKFKG